MFSLKNVDGRHVIFAGESKLYKQFIIYNVRKSMDVRFHGS